MKKGSSIMFRAQLITWITTLVVCSAHAQPPNIVLIMADDQGWGDTAYNGHQVLKTPNLDEMASKSLRFDQFYAAAPVCSPTRASVLTGRHPNRMGVFKWGHSLRPQEVTIAEALKTAGYATGHFGKWHLGSVRMNSPVNPGNSGFDVWLSAENFYDNNPILSRKGIALQLEGESSMIAADAAIDFMEKAKQADRPFLAVVWFGSPHSPFRAAAQDRSLYEGRKDADWLGEITGIDRAVGKLRSALKEMGISDNTLVWYCSDNGGLKVASTGGRARKGSVYEGGLRVPGIIEWPAKIKQPRVSKIAVNSSDIYPTLLEIAGVSVDAQPPLDGVSLLPVLENQPGAGRPAMGFWQYPGVGIGMSSDRIMKQLLEAQQKGEEPDDPELLRLEAGKITKQYPTDAFPGHSAWLDYPWKLHRIEKGPNLTWELYNLMEDPEEANPINDEKRIAAMRSALEQWLLGVVGSLNGSDYPSQQEH
jgi:arylsulfatase A-like enzyme